MKDPAQLIAEEVAKQLPVKEAYSDIVSPAAKQVGRAAEDIAKTLRIALVPFEVGGALYDRLSTLIDRSIRRVPEERRVAPAAQILGPVAEGIRYEEPDTPIFQMFEQLLASALDSERSALAHPSYPALIRQLSSDEALLLAELNKEARTGHAFELLNLSDYMSSTNRFYNHRVARDTLPRGVLKEPQRMDFYIEHLYHLGLVALYTVEKAPVMTQGMQTGERHLQHLRLMPLGLEFMRAVGSRPIDGHPVV